MDRGEAYRRKAAEFGIKARQESDPTLRAEFDKLSLAYLLLAEQAETNAKTDVVYETPQRPTVQERRGQLPGPEQPQRLRKV